MVNIIKASGETAPFEQEKLHKSLLRVGAYEELVNQIVNEVTQTLHEGMHTREIYRIAFKLLRKKSQTLAAKYHLKRAIMRLGITGYPFEKYFAEILSHKGFQVENNPIIKGFCVSHEVDIVAKKNNKHIFVECKYHNYQGKKCTVKIPLYVKARFTDILQTQKDTSTENFEMWLVTNTRFSGDALQYGHCTGLHLLGWDYPPGNSLKEQIEISGLYPITCVTQLTKAELSCLFANHIVLCKSISDDTRILDQLRIPARRKLSIIKQCQTLCRKV